MILKRLPKLSFIFLIAVMANGCAITHDIDLPQHRNETTTSEIGLGKTIVVNSPFSDQRFTKQNCGKINDLLTIKCNEDPAPWITRVLIRELSDREYTVKNEAPGSGKVDLILEGSLEQFSLTQQKNSIWTVAVVATIQVELTIQDIAGETKTMTFTGTGKSDRIFSRFREPYYSQSVIRALDEIITGLVAEVEKQTTGS